MANVLIGDVIGRGHAVADALTQNPECRLYAVGIRENPGVMDAVGRSGGEFLKIDSATSQKSLREVGAFAADKGVDYAVFHDDNMLAAGVVDTVREMAPRVESASPSREGHRGEWQKIRFRQIVAEIDAEHGTSFNPEHIVVMDGDDNEGRVIEAVDELERRGFLIAAKPDNLTGGRGVRVQGPHFQTHAEGAAYGLKVLGDKDQDGVIFEENVNADGKAIEFTLQAPTDGIVVARPHVTYDFPYREDGDSGPGTGGMGVFTMKDGRMPFLTEDDYEQAMWLTQEVVNRLNRDVPEEDRLKGVAYMSFAKTKDRLKAIELNGRGGDGEWVNVLEVAEMDYLQVVEDIAHGELDPKSIRFRNAASTFVYFVGEQYGYGQGQTESFSVDPNILASHGVKPRFSASARVGHNRYETVGTSRTIGLIAEDATPWDARGRIDEAVAAGGLVSTLVNRREVGERAYIERLKHLQR